MSTRPTTVAAAPDPKGESSIPRRMTAIAASLPLVAEHLLEANSVEKLCAFVVDDVFRGASPLPACEIVDSGAI